MNLINNLKEEIKKNKKGEPILTSEALDDTLARFLEIIEKKSGVDLITNSDALDLDMKITLERVAIQAWAAISSEVMNVYFKKSTHSHVPKQTPSPAKPNSVGSIFGNQQNKKAIPGVTNIIAVASGKGGVGKSTLSSNLATGLAMLGKKVGLLDADIYGPSSPSMLGMKGHIDISSNQKMIPVESHGVKCVSFGFLSDIQNPVMWRGPMVAKAIKQLCYDVEWGAIDYLIIDLPPGTGDVQLALIENTPITSAIIISTPQDIALIDAHKALTMFEKTKTPVLGLVENMSVYHCPNCGHEEHIFGSEALIEFSQQRKIPVLQKIPLHISIRTGGDNGRPVVLEEKNPISQKMLDLAQNIIDVI